MHLVTRRTIKFRSLIYMAFLVGVYLLVTSIFLQAWYIQNRTAPSIPVNLPYVVVHIDLKGTPLKLSYLKSLLPNLKKKGANSLLMEYEDMFPYEGKLVNLSAENCYQKNELKKFLTFANNLHFEIIPLVQTFGHMEHVLKLAEFQHLREVLQHPDSICPSKLDTIPLLKEMVKQVMKFHNPISPLKFIHIGCDEVFHLNQCRNCLKRNISDVDIFLRHVKTLTDVVKSLNADTTVLIWDDMLRGIKPHQWKDIDYFENVQPVYWDYSPEIKVMHINLLMYHKKFKHIWIASAFKGADGRAATFPVINNRFLNVFNWMSFIQEYRFGGERGVYNFKGIMLTGWSRYSHLDPPCELLPVAYPSLVISLLLINKFKTGDICAPDKSIGKVDDFIDKHLSQDTMECVHENVFDVSRCKFDGQNLYVALALYSSLDHILYKNTDGLGLKYFEYYSKLGIMNTNKAIDYMTALTVNIKARKEIQRKIVREMKDYYKEDFVTEYVNYKTYYDWKVLNKTIKFVNKYLEVQSWSRRSKNVSDYGKEFEMSVFNKTHIVKV